MHMDVSPHDKVLCNYMQHVSESELWVYIFKCQVYAMHMAKKLISIGTKGFKFISNV